MKFLALVRQLLEMFGPEIVKLLPILLDLLKNKVPADAKMRGTEPLSADAEAVVKECVDNGCPRDQAEELVAAAQAADAS